MPSASMQYAIACPPIRAQLEVLGLGGSRVVVRSPCNPARVWKLSKEAQDDERDDFKLMSSWTPQCVRALRVHRLSEEGKGGSPFFVSVLEQERLEPCPVVTPTVAFQILFSVLQTSRFVSTESSYFGL